MSGDVSEFVRRVNICLIHEQPTGPMFDKFRQTTENAEDIMVTAITSLTFCDLVKIPVLHENGVRYPRDFLENTPDVLKRLFQEHHSSEFTVEDESYKVMKILLEDCSPSESLLKKLITPDLLYEVIERAIKWDYWVCLVGADKRETYYEDIFKVIDLFIELNPALVTQADDAVMNAINVVHNNFIRKYFHELPNVRDLTYFARFIYFFLSRKFPLKCLKEKDGDDHKCIVEMFNKILSPGINLIRGVPGECAPLLLAFFEVVFTHTSCSPDLLEYDNILRHEVVDLAVYEMEDVVSSLPFYTGLADLMWRAGHTSGLLPCILGYMNTFSTCESVLHLAAIITHRTDHGDTNLLYSTEEKHVIPAILYYCFRSDMVFDKELQTYDRIMTFIYYLLKLYTVPQRCSVLAPLLSDTEKQSYIQDFLTPKIDFSENDSMHEKDIEQPTSKQTKIESNQDEGSSQPENTSDSPKNDSQHPVQREISSLQSNEKQEKQNSQESQPEQDIQDKSEDGSQQETSQPSGSDDSASETDSDSGSESEDEYAAERRANEERIKRLKAERGPIARRFLSGFYQRITDLVGGVDSLTCLAWRVVRGCLVHNQEVRRLRTKPHAGPSSLFICDHIDQIIKHSVPEHITAQLQSYTAKENMSSSDTSETIKNAMCTDSKEYRSLQRLETFYKQGILSGDFLQEEVKCLGVPPQLVNYITGLDELESTITFIWGDNYV